MPAIRPLQSDDFDSLRRLFRSFPNKAHQQRAQGIDAERLADFFTRGAEALFEKAEDAGKTVQLVAEQDGDLTAYAALLPDSWHARFYPFTFGRIAPFLTHAADDEAKRNLAGALVGAADERGLQHLIARIDGSEYDAARALGAEGFYVVDASVKLGAKLKDIPTFSPPDGAREMEVRPYSEPDLAAVQRIASGSHPFNHYYNDPYLPHEGSDALFEGWVEKCCASAANIFVLESSDGVVGFIIFLDPAGLNRAMGTRLIVLDFVCLDRRIQGRGVGRWFISETLRRLADERELVELRTSHNNYPALGCYESLGFRSISSDFILHRHGLA